MATILNPELPARPGTSWTMKVNYPHVCTKCGKGYNAHGAPSDVAAALKIPEDQRHLICPAPDEAWEEYGRLRKRATVEKFVTSVLEDVMRFTPEERREITYRIYISTPKEEV